MRITSKIYRDFSVHGYTSDKILIKIRSLSADISQIVENASSIAMGGWLPKFNQFVFDHRYIYGIIFVKIRSAVLRKVAS